MVKVTAAGDAAQGALQTFKIGTAANALVDVSVYTSGLSTTTLNRTGTSRAIPGGTLRKASQPIGRITNTLPFEIDKNALTRPLLQNLGGDTLYFEYGPLGSSPGMPRYTGSGPCPLQRPSPSNDVARYTGEIAINEMVRDTY